MSRSLLSSYSKSLFRKDGGRRQLRAYLFKLAKLLRGESGQHRLRNRAAVPPTDPPLDRQPLLGQRQADPTSVPWICRPADEPSLRQPVDHPGQGRLAEQDVPVELTKSDRIRALGQRIEDVVLLHGEILPDILCVEPPHQRRVGGQERLPGVVGGMPVRYFGFSNVGYGGSSSLRGTTVGGYGGASPRGTTVLGHRGTS